MDGVRTGHLLIADVSGYTRFVTAVELEHARDILSDLLDAVATRIAPAFSVEKVEGDAIFAVTDDDQRRLGGAELMDVVQGCYFGFSRRRDTIASRSSCECAACGGVPSLDLKIVSHHGRYATHTVAGRRELVGADVITVHRLLKNSVPLRGYALFTAVCADAAALSTDGAARHVEEYDDVGSIEGWLIDLRDRWDRELVERTVRVGAEAAFVRRYELPAPPAEVWRWATDPELRSRYQPGTDRVEQVNPGGVPGIGTRNHCVHGKHGYDEEVLDWKPCDYFTIEATSPLGTVRMTFEFERHADGTQATVRAASTGGRRQQLVMRLVGRRMLARSIDGLMDGLSRALRDELPPA